MQKIEIILAICLICIPHFLFASEKITRPTGPAVSSRPTGALDGGGGGSASVAPSIGQGAGDAAKDQGSGQGANAAIGTALSLAAIPLMMKKETMPIGMALMALSALAMKQSGEMGSSKGSNLGTQSRVNYNAQEYNHDEQVDPQDPFGNEYKLTRTEEYKKAMENFKTAEKLGFKYDPKTDSLKTPGGQASLSSLTSSGSFSKLGLGGDAFAAAKKQADKISEKVLSDINKSLVGSMEAGESSGGGGASSGSASSTGFSDEEFGGPSRGIAGLEDRGVASVAGMTKNFNGELIGVAGDSIFDMIARRYQRKDRQDFFILDKTK